MSDPIIEVTVAAPVEVVWAALRDPDQLRRWHGWVFEGLDEEIDFIYRQRSTADDEHHVLQLTGAIPDARGDRFELTAVEGGTRVRIVRGPPPPPDHEWAGYYDDVTQGWVIFSQQLRFAIERQPGRERRTVFVSAARPGAGPLTLPPELDGSPFFAVEGARGVEVRVLGPGLVVAGQAAGKELLVISTYGLEQAAFTAVVDRVAAFWSARHPDADPPSV